MDFFFFFLSLALYCKWFCITDIFLLYCIILCKLLWFVFPLFLANGVVYLSELKSEVSVSCQQDRISNKYVNNTSLSCGCGLCSHVATPGPQSGAQAGLEKMKDFHQSADQKEMKLNPTWEGKGTKVRWSKRVSVLVVAEISHFLWPVWEGIWRVTWLVIRKGLRTFKSGLGWREIDVSLCTQAMIILLIIVAMLSSMASSPCLISQFHAGGNVDYITPWTQKYFGT